jgi:hypothetical protein
MVSIGDAFGSIFKFSGGWGLLGTILIIILLSVFIFGLIACVVIYYFWRKTWTEKAMIYRVVGGKMYLTRTDKAKFKRIGRVGDRIFYIGGKTKRHLGLPHYAIAPNTWMFFERKDGELINFGLDNLDEAMQKAGVHYLHEDVRMQRLGIEKNLKEAFKKQSWWSKYGGIIMNVIYILFVTVSLVILFAKLVDVAGALKETAGAIKEMADAVKGHTGQRPSEVEGTTGLVPAFVLLLLTGGRYGYWKLKHKHRA